MEVLRDKDGQVTLLSSLFTLLNVLVKSLFWGSLLISSCLLNKKLLSVCKHYAEDEELKFSVKEMCSVELGG